MSKQKVETRGTDRTVESAQSATADSKDQALQSPAFREALRKDDEREEQSNFNPDRGIFGQTGAGPDVKKTDPLLSQKREEARAQREDGYTDGEA